jgi:hypothetical protein
VDRIRKRNRSKARLRQGSPYEKWWFSM